MAMKQFFIDLGKIAGIVIFKAMSMNYVYDTITLNLNEKQLI